MKHERCRRCNGSGTVATPYGGRHYCEICSGTGEIEIDRGDWDEGVENPDELLWPESIRWNERRE